MSNSSSGERYVKQLADLDATLRRLNSKTSELRKKKKEVQTHLHAWMVRHHHDMYEGYSVEKISPKAKSKRKPAKAKKQDALALFQQVGIDDPERFWEEFTKTQKVVVDADDADAGEGDEN